MSALRISATDIDAFRRYLDPPEWGEVDLIALLRQLRREEPPTDAMTAGSALHKALETAAVGSEFSEIEVDGIRFSFDFDEELALPLIREAKGTCEFQIDDCIVTLVGKVDAVHGRCIEDHKLTSRYDAERFLSSYQWRAYLEIFDADEFRWNIFEGRETSPRRYTLTQLHHLRVHRYPGMKDDLESEVRRFTEFAREFLPERFDAPQPERRVA